MPRRCCCFRFRLSTFRCCCCCCTVHTSSQELPLLDIGRQIPETRDNVTIKELYVSTSYVQSKHKNVSQSRIRIVTVSDTHMNHSMMKLPAGDMLIHAGDFTKWRATHENTQVVLRWLASLKQYKYKLIICGNHEVAINENDVQATVEMFKQKADTIYLQDTVFEAFGLKFYGTPWHPKRGCLYQAEAFAKPIKELERIFANIPSDTDVLITHVPPYGVRDAENAGHIGSDSLLNNCKDRVKPLMHIFGHVHGTNGISYLQGSDTVFVNSATRTFVFDIIFENDDLEVNGHKVEESQETHALMN